MRAPLFWVELIRGRPRCGAMPQEPSWGGPMALKSLVCTIQSLRLELAIGGTAHKPAD